MAEKTIKQLEAELAAAKLENAALKTGEKQKTEIEAAAKARVAASGGMLSHKQALEIERQQREHDAAMIPAESSTEAEA